MVQLRMLQGFLRALCSFLYPHCSSCFSKVVPVSLRQGLVLSSGKELQGVRCGYCHAEGFEGWALPGLSQNDTKQATSTLL